MRNRFKRAAFTLLLIAIGGYALFQARNLILGPSITVLTPQNGATLGESLVFVRGTTRNIAGMHMNDRQIFIDEEGHFEEKLLLLDGYNIITLRGADRFGRETIEILELVYK